jgi:hypothetical protein
MAAAVRGSSRIMVDVGSVIQSSSGTHSIGRSVVGRPSVVPKACWYKAENPCTDRRSYEAGFVENRQAGFGCRWRGCRCHEHLGGILSQGGSPFLFKEMSMRLRVARTCSLRDREVNRQEARCMQAQGPACIFALIWWQEGQFVGKIDRSMVGFGNPDQDGLVIHGGSLIFSFLLQVAQHWLMDALQELVTPEQVLQYGWRDALLYAF